MTRSRRMSSPYKKEPQAVADKVMKRAELSKMARNLQNRLALAQFKTKHGWEDLTLDKIEPKVEEELRRKRALEGDGLSDTSSSTSDLPPYPSRTLMSSPLKATGPLFSDAITGPSSSSGSTGHRKRTYHAFDAYNAATVLSSPTKRFRLSPTAHRSASMNSFPNSANGLNVPRAGARSASGNTISPVKPRRGGAGRGGSRKNQKFPPSAAPPASFFSHSQPNFHAPLSDSDDDTLLPAHSFHPTQIARSSPPRTPPPPSHRGVGDPQSHATRSEEGADLLLYLAASPSPAPKRHREHRGHQHANSVTGSLAGPTTAAVGPGSLHASALKAGNAGATTLMEPPSTPPSKVVRGRGDVENTPALPSSMMTPGGLFPATPGPAFDLSDFVNITPSPAQKPWKTPLAGGKTPRLGLGGGGGGLGLTRGKRLIDDMP